MPFGRLAVQGRAEAPIRNRDFLNFNSSKVARAGAYVRLRAIPPGLAVAVPRPRLSALSSALSFSRRS